MCYHYVGTLAYMQEPMHNSREYLIIKSEQIASDSCDFSQIWEG